MTLKYSEQTTALVSGLCAAPSMASLMPPPTVPAGEPIAPTRNAVPVPAVLSARNAPSLAPVICNTAGFHAIVGRDQPLTFAALLIKTSNPSNVPSGVVEGMLTAVVVVGTGVYGLLPLRGSFCESCTTLKLPVAGDPAWTAVEANSIGANIKKTKANAIRPFLWVLKFIVYFSFQFWLAIGLSWCVVLEVAHVGTDESEEAGSVDVALCCCVCVGVVYAVCIVCYVCVYEVEEVCSGNFTVRDRLSLS